MIHLFVNMSSGQYLGRVWGKTVMRGETTDIKELAEVVSCMFYHVVPCLGMVELKRGDYPGTVFLDFPFERRISKGCRLFYTYGQTPSKSELNGFGFCQSCVECFYKNVSKGHYNSGGEEEEDLNESDYEIPEEMVDPDDPAAAPDESTQGEHFLLLGSQVSGIRITHTNTLRFQTRI